MNNIEDYDISRFCYEYWKQANWDNNKLTRIKNAVGIKDDELATKVIIKKAKNYAIKSLGMTEKEFYDEINHKKSPTIKKKVSDSKEKEKDTLKKEKTDLEVARTFISAYIDSDLYTKTSFCKQVHLSLSKFNYYLSLVEKYDVEMFKAYNDKSQDHSKRAYNLAVKQVKVIINKLEDNDFDLVDYYLLTKHEYKSLNEFNESCLSFLASGVISDSEYKLIKRFIIRNCSSDSRSNVYKDLKTVKVKELMSIEERLNGEVDGYGNYIKDSGRIITDEEKGDTIKYLKDNNIPINWTTYACAKKRIIKDFNLDKNKKR